MDKKNKNNPFRKEGNGRIEKTKKETEWGKVKFNPVPKIAAAEQATPWSHFKNAIVQKQQDDDHESGANNPKNTNAQEFLKKREENYRRNLIYNKQKEPTQWEDFSEDTPAKEKKVPFKGKFQKIPSNIKNLETIKKSDFDSKMLTPQQNCFLKKVITRHTYSAKGSSFKQAVADMKLNGVKKKSFKK